MFFKVQKFIRFNYL